MCTSVPATTLLQRPAAVMAQVIDDEGHLPSKATADYRSLATVEVFPNAPCTEDLYLHLVNSWDQ